MTQINDEYLKHVPINNPELLEILDGYTKLHTLEGFEDNVHLSAKEHARQRSYWVGDKIIICFHVMQIPYSKEI